MRRRVPKPSLRGPRGLAPFALAGVLAVLVLTLLLPAPPASRPTLPASSPLYTVTFTAAGLAPGTNWTVTLDGGATTTSNTSIVFWATDGLHRYTVSGSDNYQPVSSSGVVNVDRAPLRVIENFVVRCSDCAGPSILLPAYAWLLLLGVGGGLLGLFIVWWIRSLPPDRTPPHRLAPISRKMGPDGFEPSTNRL